MPKKKNVVLVSVALPQNIARKKRKTKREGSDRQEDKGDIEIDKNATPESTTESKKGEELQESNCHAPNYGLGITQHTKDIQEEEDQHGNEESIESRTQSNNSEQTQISEKNTSRRSRSRHKSRGRKQKDGNDDQEEDKKEQEKSKEASPRGRSKNRRGDKNDNDKVVPLSKRGIANKKHHPLIEGYKKFLGYQHCVSNSNGKMRVFGIISIKLKERVDNNEQEITLNMKDKDDSDSFIIAIYAKCTSTERRDL
ncbi:uncharacterized protein LOC132053776 [Lycium ferocissimum]|uniref:uncharacterized protein LOC132053776 n=1 Tax=Lycium ferocissimum TaxID=112874 RepID=UPI0028159CB1|nr:uncharacterized protein LOC132053776 [Lycium ferocissimum]